MTLDSDTDDSPRVTWLSVLDRSLALRLALGFPSGTGYLCTLAFSAGPPGIQLSLQLGLCMALWPSLAQVSSAISSLHPLAQPGSRSIRLRSRNRALAVCGSKWLTTGSSALAFRSGPMVSVSVLWHPVAISWHRALGSNSLWR